MGVRAAFRALFGRAEKASEAGPLIAMVHGRRPQETLRNYASFAREAYERNVVAYRAINEVAQSAASVPWRLIRNTGADREEIDSHPVLNLLSKPNPQQGGSEFIEAVLGFFQLAGNAYIEAVGPEGRPPQELWTLRPDRMKLIPGESGIPEAYTYTISSQVKRWDVDPMTGQGPILHLKRFHPTNDFYGLSTIEAVAKSIDQRNAADKWNLSLLQNEARPSGAVVYEPKDAPSTLTDEQFARLKVEIEEQYSGADNAGRPLMLEGGLKWQQMSMSPKDMDFLDAKHTSSRDIALAFGVPPQLVGIPGDTTFANYREARLALWEETVIPLLRHLRDEFNNWLLPMFQIGQQESGLELDLDLDEVPALTLRRELKFEMTQQADFLTVNEKRQALGYDDIDGGDVVLIPATMLPLGESDSNSDTANDNEPSDEEAARFARLAYGDPAEPESTGETARMARPIPLKKRARS